MLTFNNKKVTGLYFQGKKVKEIYFQNKRVYRSGGNYRTYKTTFERTSEYRYGDSRKPGDTTRKTQITFPAILLSGRDFEPLNRPQVRVVSVEWKYLKEPNLNTSKAKTDNPVNGDFAIPTDNLKSSDNDIIFMGKMNVLEPYTQGFKRNQFAIFGDKYESSISQIRPLYKVEITITYEVL